MIDEVFEVVAGDADVDANQLQVDFQVAGIRDRRLPLHESRIRPKFNFSD